MKPKAPTKKLTVRIEIKRTNLRGDPVGESHPNTRYSDEIVAKARAMRARGMTYRAIGEIVGAHMDTVKAWCRNRYRKPHARVMPRRRLIYE